MITIFKEKFQGMNAPENVTETRYALIFDQIRLNEKVTIDQLTDIFNINRRTIIRDIEKLQEEGKIKRIGPAKGGHWQIVEK